MPDTAPRCVSVLGESAESVEVGACVYRLFGEFLKFDSRADGLSGLCMVMLLRAFQKEYRISLTASISKEGRTRAVWIYGLVGES